MIHRQRNRKFSTIIFFSGMPITYMMSICLLHDFLIDNFYLFTLFFEFLKNSLLSVYFQLNLIVLNFLYLVLISETLLSFFQFLLSLINYYFIYSKFLFISFINLNFKLELFSHI